MQLAHLVHLVDSAHLTLTMVGIIPRVVRIVRIVKMVGAPAVEIAHYLGKNELSKKVLVCLFPIIPRMSSLLSKKILNTEISENQWPEINKNLIE